MKNLVLAVSPDSSLDLLKPHADIIVLDKDVPEFVDEYYDTVYIRSHFSQPSTMPQNFQSEIEEVVERIKHTNNNVRFIDGMYTVDAIVAFEDKWLQYETFNEFMPRTQLLDTHTDISSFVRPIYKNRLSSRGSGVTWNRQTAEDSVYGWIVQESIEVEEELRVYIILGEVYSVGAVKRSMMERGKAESISSRALSQDEIDFSSRIIKQSPGLDMVGIDMARSVDGRFYLIEVNRSPGFAKFCEITGVNLAERLYEHIDDY